MWYNSSISPGCGRNVRDLVGNGQSRLAGFRAERGRQTQLAAEKTSFIDNARHRDLARVAVDGHLDLVGGRVGDFAMQRRAERAVGIEVRPAVAFQAATDEQLVEPPEPAQPARLPKRDEGGMNRPLGGRLPTELHVAATRPPNAHAAGWNHDESEPPVVDLDHIDPVAQSAAKGPFCHAVATSRAADLIGAEGKLFHVNAGVNVGEGPGFSRHGDWSPGGSGNGNSIRRFSAV